MSVRVEECKHGIDKAWCSLCQGAISLKNDRAMDKGSACCSPGCRRRAERKVGSLPLCAVHVLMIEKTIVRHWKWEYQRTSTAPMLHDSRVDWVYFVQIGDLLKIGHSVSLRSRIRSFAAYGQPVEVLAIEAGGRALEGRLHRRFADHRADAGLSRELFYPSDEIMEYIRIERTCVHCKRKAATGRVVCREHIDDRLDEEDLIGATFN